MAKFNVVMASKNREYTFKGKDDQDVPMVEYQVALVDETNAQRMGMMSRSAKRDAPKDGEELQGHWENTEKFGWQFKEDRQGGSGGAGGRGGYGGKSQEERNEIMAEKAVAEANLFLIGKGNFMLEMHKLGFVTEKELKNHLANFSGVGLKSVGQGMFDMYKKMSAVSTPAAATSPAETKPDPDNAPEPVDPTPGVMPDGSPEQVIKPEEIPF